MKSFFGLLFLLALSVINPSSIYSQIRNKIPPPPPITIDTSKDYTEPSIDSIRRMDSAYTAQKILLEQWAKRQPKSPATRNDFISGYLELGTLMRIRANDLNEFFSERAGRPDPSSDRNTFSKLDWEAIVGVRFKLDRTWGVFVEYDLSQRSFSTIIDDSTIPSLFNAQEDLTLTTHSIVTGPFVVIYDSRIYQLIASGGIGAVFALTSERESVGGASRNAQATGLQINFDLINDFRFADWGSFTIDLASRSIQTGTLKTSDGSTLDQPFGVRHNRATLAPTASNLTLGLAVGATFYF